MSVTEMEVCPVEDFSDASSITTSDLMSEMSDSMSETTSLSSSILNYQYENGRRYHAFKAGNYIMPNDQEEQDRLDILHHVHCMVLGGELFTAPVKNPQAILDIGTGTGLWAIEVADRFPDAKVIATDLSAIQPGWIPPNVSFEIDDSEAEWNFPCRFDYIHLRNMGGAIADWPGLLRKCMDNLNPGGYLEIIDPEAWGSTDDNSLPDTSSYYEWQININKAARAFGRDMNIIPQMKNIVADAGFEEVYDKNIKVPLGQWEVMTRQQREWATYMNVVMLECLEAYSLGLFTRVLGWGRERLDKLLDGVRADLTNPKYHLYTNMHHVCGRKPEAQ